MRILVAHSRYRSEAPSGENNVVDQESAALAAAGHDVFLFQRCSDDIARWPLRRRLALPVLSVDNPEVQRTLRQRLDDWRPDVVHVHNTFPLLSPSVLRACRDARVPVVATIHNYKLLCASGDFFRDGSPCHDCADGSGRHAIEHGCYRGSRLATLPVSAGIAANRHLWRELVSAYVFISASQRDLMRSLDLPEDRVFVKHNFVPGPQLPHAPGPRTGISYVGRLDEAKGTPVLMRAWEAFRARHPGTRLTLTIAGRGPLAERVRNWAAEDPQVDYRGLVSREEARLLVSASLAAIVPSAWEETFGLVAVEAMAVGVAPVAPATGSFPELIEDTVDGLLYRRGADGLAAAIAAIEADPVRLMDLGDRAEQTYRSRFEPMSNLEQLLDIYRFAIASPRSTAVRSSTVAR